MNKYVYIFSNIDNYEQILANINNYEQKNNKVGCPSEKKGDDARAEGSAFLAGC